MDSVKSAPRKNHNQFVATLWNIVNSSAHKDVCSWTAAGDALLIKKIPEFICQVLPQFFNHGNLQSFVRQLNMYDFHKISLKKTSRQTSWQCFQHEHFLKARPDLLGLIKRKQSQSAASSGSSGSSVGSARIKDEFDNHLSSSSPLSRSHAHSRTHKCTRSPSARVQSSSSSSRSSKSNSRSRSGGQIRKDEIVSTIRDMKDAMDSSMERLHVMEESMRQLRTQTNALSGAIMVSQTNEHMMQEKMQQLICVLYNLVDDKRLRSLLGINMNTNMLPSRSGGGLGLCLGGGENSQTHLHTSRLLATSSTGSAITANGSGITANGSGITADDDEAAATTTGVPVVEAMSVPAGSTAGGNFIGSGSTTRSRSRSGSGHRHKRLKISTTSTAGAGAGDCAGAGASVGDAVPNILKPLTPPASITRRKHATDANVDANADVNADGGDNMITATIAEVLERGFDAVQVQGPPGSILQPVPLLPTAHLHQAATGVHVAGRSSPSSYRLGDAIPVFSERDCMNMAECTMSNPLSDADVELLTGSPHIDLAAAAWASPQVAPQPTSAAAPSPIPSPLLSPLVSLMERHMPPRQAKQQHPPSNDNSPRSTISDSVDLISLLD